MVCTKCKNTKFEYKAVGPHIGAYCASCGSFIKWLNKKEKLEIKEEIEKLEEREAYDCIYPPDDIDDLPWY